MNLGRAQKFPQRHLQFLGISLLLRLNSGIKGPQKRQIRCEALLRSNIQAARVEKDGEEEAVIGHVSEVKRLRNSHRGEGTR